MGHKESFMHKPSTNLEKEEIVIAQFGASPRGAIIFGLLRRRCFCRSFWLGGFYRPIL
jgi:hypothetical protein